MSSGTQARAGCIQVFVMPAAADTRVGLAVRVPAGRAVTRNRARRRLRAAFEHCTVASPVDVVIRTDQRVAEMDFQELVNSLCASIAEAGG